MTVVIDGSTGIDAVQNGVIVQADLASNVVGNGPCFSAYGNALQTAASGVPLKIAYNIETIDTNTFYDNTNYRFLPAIAGYYYMNAVVTFSAAPDTSYGSALLYKNGVGIVQGSKSNNNATVGVTCTVSGLVYLNGSTDYVEVFGLQNQGAITIGASQVFHVFQGFLARAA